MESVDLKLRLIELVLQLHRLFLVLAQLVLQTAQLRVSRLNVLLSAVSLKLQTAYQLLPLLLHFQQPYALVLECLVLTPQLVVLRSSACLKHLDALLCAAKVEIEARIFVLELHFLFAHDVALEDGLLAPELSGVAFFHRVLVLLLQHLHETALSLQLDAGELGLAGRFVLILGCALDGASRFDWREVVVGCGSAFKFGLA